MTRRVGAALAIAVAVFAGGAPLVHDMAAGGDACAQMRFNDCAPLDTSHIVDLRDTDHDGRISDVEAGA